LLKDGDRNNGGDGNLKKGNGGEKDPMDLGELGRRENESDTGE